MIPYAQLRRAYLIGECRTLPSAQMPWRRTGENPETYGYDPRARAWVSLEGGGGRPAPIRPVRGQIIAIPPDTVVRYRDSDASKRLILSLTRYTDTNEGCDSSFLFHGRAVSIYGTDLENFGDDEDWGWKDKGKNLRVNTKVDRIKFPPETTWLLVVNGEVVAHVHFRVEDAEDWYYSFDTHDDRMELIEDEKERDDAFLRELAGGGRSKRIVQIDALCSKQGGGYGRLLMLSLMAAYPRYNSMLYSLDNPRGFYKKLGFKRNYATTHNPRSHHLRGTLFLYAHQKKRLLKAFSKPRRARAAPHAVALSFPLDRTYGGFF